MVFDTSYDWFIQDVRDGNYNYSKIKRQSISDQSYYTGQLKIDFKDIKSIKMKKSLKEGTIVLVKPNFLTCKYKKTVNSKKVKINLLGESISVRMKDIVLAKLPVYKKIKQTLEFYHKDLNKWVICQLVKINEDKRVYKI